MGNITYRDGVSITEIAMYLPALTIACYLAIRHGFSRNSGWLFLIVFCLARIIGPLMRFATISNPRSVALYTGSAILTNVGLSPLEMAALGFLSRLLPSISKKHKTTVHPRMIHGAQLIVLVGLILGIVGGINASDAIKNGAPYHPGTLSKAGTALIAVSYVLLITFCAFTYSSVEHAEPGEKRLFLAVVLSLTFLAVRLIYSCCNTFTTKSEFNLLTGNVTILVCAALLPEFISVVIFETMGLTLQKTVKEEHVEAAKPTHPQSLDSDSPMQAKKQRGGDSGDNALLKIAKKTIVGRIVMSVIPSRKEEVKV